MLSKGFCSGGAPSFDSPIPRVLATDSCSFEVVLTGLLVAELLGICVVIVFLGVIGCEVFTEESIVIFGFEILFVELRKSALILAV